jgi:hypothetical protein
MLQACKLLAAEFSDNCTGRSCLAKRLYSLAIVTDVSATQLARQMYELPVFRAVCMCVDLRFTDSVCEPSLTPWTEDLLEKISAP